MYIKDNIRLLILIDILVFEKQTLRRSEWRKVFKTQFAFSEKIHVIKG